MSLINFMLSLFYQILYLSIVATVIGGVILLVRKLTDKKLSPNANYLICLVFLIALIFPVALPSRVSIYNLIDIEKVKYVSSKDVNTIMGLNDVNEEKVVNQFRVQDYKIYRNYITIVVAFIWFIVFVLKLVKKMILYFALGGSVGSEVIDDERVELILERCKEKLKIKRKFKIVKHHFVKTPGTSGIFNVKILMTDVALELDDMQLSNIFIHELIHYKRKDNVVNFIMLVLKSVYWFNPMVETIFEIMRDDMELATDEIANSKLDSEEQRVYCRLMLLFSAVPALPDLKKEEILGMASGGKKMIQKRIDMIGLQQTFEKNAKIILAVTVMIITFLCFAFYPTSYGRNLEPKLYWKLENGEKLELTKVQGNLTEEINEVRLTPESEVKLQMKEGKPNGSVFFNVMNLSTMEFEKSVNVLDNKIKYFESGEYIYQFTIPYGNNQTINYAIKIIVE